ncbi:MAG: DHA2 family efflux MFS transporter permease subunit [Mycobacteriaceae bacterium]|uniref:DHA2 family efflux MFS transporter permease subunit n=1 Tax=Corynebacterium sp. TaxID=1720 RepID=UPI003F98A751
MTVADSGRDDATSTARDGGATVPLWPVFVALALAVFMFSVNQNMLSVALPTIVGELDGADNILWVSTSYMVASMVTLLVYGKLGDVFGLKRLFLVALGTFVVACVLGSFSTSMGWLVAVRFVQGLGGGGLVVLAQAILAAVVPPERRGRYMGIVGAVMVLSTVAGPVLGGLITEHWGWRWCFGVNVPFGIVAWFLAVRFIRIPADAVRGTAVRRQLDVAGMAVVAIVVSGIVLVTALGGRQYAWTDPVILSIAALIVVALGVFIIVEKRSGDPVLPGYLVRNRNFLAVVVVDLVLNLGIFGITTYMPTYIQIVRGVDASVSGLVLLPLMVTMFIFSTLAGFFVSRTQRYRVTVAVGCIVAAGGLAALGMVDTETPLVWFMLILGFVGVGFGINAQLTVLVVQNSFPVKVVGTATAANQLFRNLGSTMGISLVGSLFTARLVEGIQRTAPDVAYSSITPGKVAGFDAATRADVVAAYHDALIPVLLGMAPLMALGVLSALFIRDRSFRSAGGPAETTEETVQ